MIYNMIRQNLEMEPLNREDRKKQVFAVNGSITAYLRKRWGLMQKDRSTDTHHAMDAVVVACCTDGMIQKISRSTQYREVLYKGQSHPDYEIVDVETGEIISLEDLSREEWDERYGAQVPPPWEHFKEELEVRMGVIRRMIWTHIRICTSCSVIRKMCITISGQSLCQGCQITR